MSMSANDVLQMIKDREIKFVDFRFTDTRGKEQHVGVPVKCMGMDKFEDGHAFDGSSIAGWKGIQASDMLLMPDPTTAFLDPFMDENTLVITCDVVEPTDGKGYDRDPRSIAKRAEMCIRDSLGGGHLFTFYHASCLVQLYAIFVGVFRRNCFAVVCSAIVIHPFV